VEPLLRENAELQEKIVSLARKIGTMAVAIQRIDSEAEKFRELVSLKINLLSHIFLFDFLTLGKYEATKVVPYEAYRYQIEDALLFARFLAFHMFDASDIDLNRCYVSVYLLINLI